MELIRKVYEYTSKDIGPIHSGGNPQLKTLRKTLISTMSFGTTSSEVDVNWTSLVGIRMHVCVCVCVCLGITRVHAHLHILPIIRLVNSMYIHISPSVEQYTGYVVIPQYWFLIPSNTEIEI